MSRDRLRTSICAAGALAGVLTLGALLPTRAVAAPQEVRAELQTAEAPVDSLALDDRIPLAGGAAVYRFGQERGGVPVEGGEAIVVDTAGEGAELVADETDGEVAPPAEPAIAERRAIEKAIAAVGATDLTGRPNAALVIDRGGDGTLAWRVSVPSERPLADFEVLVDATTGAVIEQLDLSWRATGAANLFLPNAVIENGGYGNPPGLFDIADRRDRDSIALTALRSPVTLERLSEAKPCLKGQYAEARVGRRKKPVCRESRNWSGVTRAAERFEALMAYLHVDAAQDYLLDLGAPGVADKRQLVIAGGFKEDNSFYMPSADVVRLGTGGVDDGEDGDVIVHEFGHAVQDTQRPGFGRGAQAGAIGEGWGDYFAAAISEELWGTSGEFSVCVMEWDAVSYDVDTAGSPGICLRRTDVARSVSEQRQFCEDDFQGRNEIHCVGEAWSSALWELREELGTEPAPPNHNIMDRVILQSHPMYPRAATFATAAEAMVLADETLYGADDHCTEIRAEMVQRQFLPTSTPTC